MSIETINVSIMPRTIRPTASQQVKLQLEKRGKKSPNKDSSTNKISFTLIIRKRRLPHMYTFSCFPCRHPQRMGLI